MGNRNNRKRNNRKRKSDKVARPGKPMTLNDFVALVTGGIHAIEPVAVEPQTRISQWALYLVRSVQGVRTRHLVGRANGEGRVSSPITAIDIGMRTATSQSGRVYRLIGDGGFDSDGRYVFNAWLRGTQATVVREVTPALRRLLNTRAGPTQTNPQTHPQTLNEKRTPL